MSINYSLEPVKSVISGRSSRCKYELFSELKIFALSLGPTSDLQRLLLRTLSRPVFVHKSKSHVSTAQSIFKSIFKVLGCDEIVEDFMLKLLNMEHVWRKSERPKCLGKVPTSLYMILTTFLYFLSGSRNFCHLRHGHLSSSAKSAEILLVWHVSL